MLRLQAEARALQSQPHRAPGTAGARNAAIQSLRDISQQVFGARADLAPAGGDATVTLRGVSAGALAEWLARARTEVHCSPMQAHLSRTGATWSGTLQMGLSAP